MSTPQSLLPPFDQSSAHAKVKVAQKLWNTCNPEQVAKAYTTDSIWRNRDQFLHGQDAIKAFLTSKWEKETQYRLRKELFSFNDNKIAVQFWYEYHNAETRTWHRAYGLEHWTFDPQGKMAKRQMSANDIQITDADRWFKQGMTESDVDSVSIGDQHW